MEHQGFTRGPYGSRESLADRALLKIRDMVSQEVALVLSDPDKRSSMVEKLAEYFLRVEATNAMRTRGVVTRITGITFSVRQGGIAIVPLSGENPLDPGTPGKVMMNPEGESEFII